MSDDEEPDDQKVTEADAIVQTPNGERYRAAELSKGGYPNERSSRLSDLVRRIFQR